MELTRLPKICRKLASVTRALPETQRIDDAVAREGIDVDPLLIGEQNLLHRRIQIENTPVEVLDVLDERHFELQPGLAFDADRIAELQDQRLLRLPYGKRGAQQQDDRDDGDDGDDDRACSDSSRGLLPPPLQFRRAADKEPRPGRPRPN